MLILTLDTKVHRRSHGNKAVWLSKLLRARQVIPPTIIVSSVESASAAAVSKAFHKFAKGQKVIVRSSSRQEDSANRSLAGCFASEIVLFSEIPAAIARIRQHALSLGALGFREQNLPVLIQPLIEGWGGVYLSELSGSGETLVLSKLGVSAVTTGLGDGASFVGKNHPIFVSALEACRKVRDSLQISIDLEFVVKDGGIIFLQCRPLTCPIPSQDRHGLSEHFPTPLRRLVGELWQNVLSAKLGVALHFKDNYLVGFPDDASGVEDKALARKDLEKALRFYRTKLFPRWNRILRKLPNECRRVQGNGAWRVAHEAWLKFLDDYFNNPHEQTVRAAVHACESGVGISPNFLKRMRLYRNVQKSLFISDVPRPIERVANAPAMRAYLAEFGSEFLVENDFSTPTLMERPDLFLASMPSPQVAPRLPRLERTLLREVAWLAEEDNGFKGRFGRILRAETLRLASIWLEEKKLTDAEHIWDCGLSDLESEGKYMRSQSRPESNVFKTVQTEPRSLHLPAVILSPGNAIGRASLAGNATEDSILIRPTLNPQDYVALSHAAGAIVAAGSLTCHGALFARDIGKPLFRCPALFQLATEDVVLRLCMMPSQIEITRPQKGDSEFGLSRKIPVT
jgi:hypothetical protein